ncbi:unnamed protein product [Paramecium sonneborni]|uniref:Uncharacterized protein n=1 Tax=Paramecium sonneborni TaxID=65129 RepID=A0A8S1PER7_9CILI|nr:unnamed protein product [Paramecium sonneborni]
MIQYLTQYVFHLVYVLQTGKALKTETSKCKEENVQKILVFFLLMSANHLQEGCITKGIRSVNKSAERSFEKSFQLFSNSLENFFDQFR